MVQTYVDILNIHGALGGFGEGLYFGVFVLDFFRFLVVGNLIYKILLFQS